MKHQGKYTLIKDANGVQCVLSSDLRNHKGCKILERGVTAPRVDGLERKDGRWRIKPEARRALDHALYRTMTRGELGDHFQSQIDELRAEVEKLTAAAEKGK